MKNDHRLRRWELALILALSITILHGAWTQPMRVCGWWCVVFPPLYPAAAAETMVRADDPAGDYEIRFWIADLWNSLFENETTAR